MSSRALVQLSAVLALPMLVGCPGAMDRTLDPGDSRAWDGSNSDGQLVFPDAYTGEGPPPDAGAPADTGQPPDAGKPSPDTMSPDATSCASFPEKLDKKDNNCNKKIDEGFWANTKNVTFTALYKQHPSCGASKPLSDACMAAANRHCKALGYSGGFGPVEFGPSAGVIVCLADALISSATLASLNAKHPGCHLGTVLSLQCNSAIHRFCKDSGYVSGVGPLEHSSTASHIACVKHAKVYQVSFATLAAHHTLCKASSSFSKPCHAAINRFCQSKGHATGFGPVEQSTNAWVTCLDAK